MASKCLSFFSVCLVNAVLMISIFNTPTAAAKVVKVGDGLGWHQPDVNHTHFFSLWASRRKFYVGDSLRFEYKNDSVLVVDKWAYYHCNTTNPISVFKDGNTVITLDEPGPVYFVSGDTDHCEHGQRLLIDVVEVMHSPPPMGTPEEPYSEMAPAPSPLTSSSGVKVSETLFLALLMTSSMTVVLVTFILA